MHVVEVMAAAAVFALASGNSVQLWSRAAVGSQLAELRLQQEERIHLDHLQLEAHWRSDRSQPSGCGVSSEQLIAVAATLPVPPQVHREVSPSDQQPDAVLVRWSVESAPNLRRERLFTPAGLGLCQAQVTP